MVILQTVFWKLYMTRIFTVSHLLLSQLIVSPYLLCDLHRFLLFTQLRTIKVTPANSQELQDEAEWIFTHAFSKASLSNQVSQPTLLRFRCYFFREMYKMSSRDRSVFRKC